jgi:hypothetical protein
VGCTRHQARKGAVSKRQGRNKISACPPDASRTRKQHTRLWWRHALLVKRTGQGTKATDPNRHHSDKSGVEQQQQTQHKQQNNNCTRAKAKAAARNARDGKPSTASSLRVLGAHLGAIGPTRRPSTPSGAPEKPYRRCSDALFYLAWWLCEFGSLWLFMSCRDREHDEACKSERVSRGDKQRTLSRRDDSLESLPRSSHVLLACILVQAWSCRLTPSLSLFSILIDLPTPPSSSPTLLSSSRMASSSSPSPPAEHHHLQDDDAVLSSLLLHLGRGYDDEQEVADGQDISSTAVLFNRACPSPRIRRPGLPPACF